MLDNIILLKKIMLKILSFKIENAAKKANNSNRRFTENKGTVDFISDPYRLRLITKEDADPCGT